MKKLKFLTCLLATVLLTACQHHASEDFSSGGDSSTSQPSGSSGSGGNSGRTDIVYYRDYYSSLVSWENGEDLKNQLYTIMRNGFQPLTYVKSSKQNYDTNIDADHSKYDFEYLDVIYSKNTTFKSDTNKGWQREHAFCASLMCGTGTSDAVKMKGRATDFHNLFAANASGNQSRGNKNYGNADTSASSYTTVFSSDGGKDGYRYDETIFEPGDVDKGRLARAIFYMATMYKDDEQDTVNNILMKGLRVIEEEVVYDKGSFVGEGFAIGHLSDLLEWNQNIPVDYLEMQHNISVYKNTNNPDGIAQGNRNPYVDYPGLVDYVYGSKKNQPGTLKDVEASASYLGCEEEGISHYAIKEAKREYGFGDKISASDYKVIAVNKDYTYSDADINLSHSLANHTFAESDGDTIDAKITTPSNEIGYQIILNPLAACTNFVALSSSGINTKSHNAEQEISFDGEEILFTYNTSIDASTAFYVRNITAGGVTLGSGNSQLTGLTIKTKGSYTVDRAFIKANASNTSSSFSLIIKVGDTVLLPSTTVDYNSGNFKVFGAKANEPLTGQVSFIFSGGNALKLNSIAFNAISV